MCRESLFVFAAVRVAAPLPLSYACSHSSPPSILEPLLFWVYNAQHSSECREKQAVREDPGLAFFFLCFIFLLAFCKGPCSNQKIPWRLLPWDLCAQLVSYHISTRQWDQYCVFWLADFREGGKIMLKRPFLKLLRCPCAIPAPAVIVEVLSPSCALSLGWRLWHHAQDCKFGPTGADHTGFWEGLWVLWMGKRFSMPSWPWAIPCASSSCSW